MILNLLSLLIGFTPSAQALCPNAFSYNGENLCANLVWDKAEVIKGDKMMSPVLNIGNPLPFETYLSSVWVQIWKEEDPSYKKIFPEGLEAKPFMVMLEQQANHGAFAEVNNDAEKGILLSKIKFEQMVGCWYITLQGEDLFHMIKILNYTNLDVDQNIEQGTYCEVCSSLEITPPSNDHHHHSH